MVERYTITFDVSLFAKDLEDADHFAVLIQQQMDKMLGGGQTIVKHTDTYCEK